MTFAHGSLFLALLGLLSACASAPVPAPAATPAPVASPVPDAPPEDGSTETRAEILATIETYARSIRERDPELLRETLDMDRMVDRACALLDLEPSFVEDVKHGVRAGLPDQVIASSVPFERARIIRIESSDQEEELVALSRMYGPQGSSSFFRCWMQRGEDGWRIWDIEDLDLGLRMSAGMCAGLAGALGGAGEAMAAFGRASRVAPGAFARDDWASAEAALDEVDVEGLPLDFQAVHWALLATALSGQDRMDEALEALDRAERARPEMPILQFSRGTILYAQGELEPAVGHVRRYLELLGDHSKALQLLGAALAGLGRDAEAADAFRRGLEDQPLSVESLIGLARVLPAENHDELRRPFRGLEDPSFQLDEIGGELLQTGHLDALAVFADELSRIDPEDPNSAYYMAEVHLERGRPERAAELLAEVLDRVEDPEEQAFYVELYLDACVESGQALRGYRRAPDKPHAFDYIGGILVDEWDGETLRRLFALHEKDYPDDIWLPYYRAQAHWLDDDLEAVEREYRKGFLRHEDAPVDDVVRESYRWLWVESLYEVGRGLYAYENVGPREDTYLQLVDEALDYEDGEFLLELAELRKRDEPGDVELPLVLGIGHSFSGEHAEALEYLEPHAAELGEDDYFLWALERSLVVSGIELERFDLALDIARRSTARDGDPWYEAVVYAWRGRAGDAERALRALETCLEQGYGPETFAQDPYLGPALEGDEFAGLRAEYPEAFGNQVGSPAAGTIHEQE